MKTKPLIAIIALIASISSAAHPADNYPIPVSLSPSSGKLQLQTVFGAFHAHRQQTGVALSWSVVSNTVTGFVVERSYDGAYFLPVDELPAATTGRWNKYKDNDVYPGYIHYRIAAVMNDGAVIYSNVEVVRIVSRKG
jgi:hypothetical protein